MVTMVIITALSPLPAPSFWLQLVCPCWDSCHCCTAQQINFHKDVGLSLALPQPSMPLTEFPGFTPTNSATCTPLLPESNLPLQPHWLHSAPSSWVDTVYLQAFPYAIPPTADVPPVFSYQSFKTTSKLLHTQSTLTSLSRSDFAL